MFTRHKEFSAPGRREHQFEKHTNCELAHCPICDGGLQFCTVCRQGEADLAAECPGPPSSIAAGAVRASTGKSDDSPIVLQGMSILDAAFAKVKSPRTSSSPAKDAHVMTSALELMQAIVLRDVPITPQDFYYLVIGHPPPPIDMVLHCSKCGLQHIDAPDEPDAYCHTVGDGSCVSTDPRCMHQLNPAPRWTNPPHRSHQCKGCGHVWRPADVPTNGVAAVKTQGKNDSPITPRK